MSSCYEEDIEKKIDKNLPLPEKLNISVVKYFWQASPLSGSKTNSIPKFLRGIKSLNHFTDNELRLFAQYLHLRTFAPKEKIFKQNHIGYGFYFIMTGSIAISAKGFTPFHAGDYEQDLFDETRSNESSEIATLERFDHFGELALLEENSVRTASATAKSSAVLLGVFKPDIEELINRHPVIGAKLLQAISVILASRISTISDQITTLKQKVKTYENNAKK